MIDILVSSNMWLVAALVWCALLLIVLRRPPAFGRWLSACEIATPWWVTLIFFASAALSGMAFSFYFHKLLEATMGEGPAQPSFSALLQWLLAFVSQGITGPLKTRALLQGALFWAGLFLTCTVLLYRQRYSILAMDITARRDEEAVPRRAVVMGLSTRFADEAASDAVRVFSNQAAALDLDAAAQADLGGFPWQQNLRVLRHHLLRPLPTQGWLKGAWRWLARRPQVEPCRVVVIMPSRESAPFAEAFIEVATACAENSGCSGVQFQTWPHAVDYNDLGGLRRELLAVVRKLLQDPRTAARPNEISIDTTPGMKLVSIAGAAVTFASPLEFTYVETQAPNSVIAFDVRAGFRMPIER
jgi:hypothetical protein